MALSSTASSMYFSFLRPLCLPRVATLNRFLSTSTSTSTASAQPFIIPLHTKSVFKRSKPDNPSTTADPISSSEKSLPATQLPYQVNRSEFNNLPIYQLAKRGGNLKQTMVRRTEGNVNVLRSHLQAALGLEEKEVAVNQLTKHIIIKGWRKHDVEKFLLERGF